MNVRIFYETLINDVSFEQLDPGLIFQGSGLISATVLSEYQFISSIGKM